MYFRLNQAMRLRGIAGYSWKLKAFFILMIGIVQLIGPLRAQNRPLIIQQTDIKRHTGDLVVVAYVTSWTKSLPDPQMLTHINYAFGHVNKSFNGVRIDNIDRLKKIVALKRAHPHLKVCLSIGGWGSGGFSEMAANASSRDSFAVDVARKLQILQLDGVDLDWEYPTSSSAKISSSPEDTKNFTLLVESIRKAIGPDKLLTMASSAGAGYVDFKAVVPYMDFVNIMAYDMSSAPRHHSGLFRSSMSPHLTGAEAVERHIQAGVPARKLVLGIPFYGHGRSPIKGYVDYKDIKQLQGFIAKWDDTAKVPYLTDSSGKVLLNYENPTSIAIKCQYIKDHHLLGAMYWEYDADDQHGSLRKAVFDGLGLNNEGSKE